MDYFIQKDGKQAGPYGLDQMRSFWRNGQITLTTLYWTTGLTDWQPVRLIEGVLAARPSGPTIPAIVRSPEKPKRKGLGCRSGCLILLCIGAVGFVILLALGGTAGETPDHKNNPYEGDYSGPNGVTLKISGTWSELNTAQVSGAEEFNGDGVSYYEDNFTGAITNQTTMANGSTTFQVLEVFAQTKHTTGSLFNSSSTKSTIEETGPATLVFDGNGNVTYTLTDQGRTTVYQLKSN